MFKRFIFWLALTVILMAFLRLLPFTFNLLSPLANKLASQDNLYKFLQWPMTAETYSDMDALALLVLCLIPSGIISLILNTIYNKPRKR